MPDLRLTLPDSFWDAPETRRALTCRDLAALLRLVHAHGVTQRRIAAAVTLQQSRVSEIVNGRRSVTAFEVVVRIVEGLRMPDEARLRVGLAPAAATRRW